MKGEMSIKVTKDDHKTLGAHFKKKVHQLIKNEPILKTRIKDLEKEVEALKEGTTLKSSAKPTESTKPIETVKVPPCPYVAPQSDGTLRCQNPSKKAKAWQLRSRLVTVGDCGACLKRKSFITERKGKKIEKAKELPFEPETPTKYERSIETIVNELGVCVNPIVMSKRPILCVVCKKRCWAKWQACQEIQQELKMSPLQRRNFIEAHIESLKHPSQMDKISAETQSMTIQEIEAELGLRTPVSPNEASKTTSEKPPSCFKHGPDLNNPKCKKCIYSIDCKLFAEPLEPNSIDEAIANSFKRILDETPPLRFVSLKTIKEEQPVDNAVFDAVNTHFHELCKKCEELQYYGCTHYCSKFLNGLNKVHQVKENIKEKRSIMPDVCTYIIDIDTKKGTYLCDVKGIWFTIDQCRNCPDACMQKAPILGKV